MIELKNIYKSYGKVEAVNNISLKIAGGEIFGLVGSDGAGKTTLIRMVAGLLKPTKGNISLMHKESIEEVKALIGYVPQKFSLYEDLTVMENIKTISALYNQSPKMIEFEADKILAFTKLLPFKDREASKLSGGMKQKLALAAALVHKPKLLLLDEPTTGVDPVSRREFWQILFGLNRDGMTIFISTPYMDEAELCTRVAFLQNREIIACSPPEIMRQEYPYQLIELETRSRNIKSILVDESILDINMFGNKYHIVVAGNIAAIDLIKARMSALNIEVLKVRMIKPTLEDVFVALAKTEGA